MTPQSTPDLAAISDRLAALVARAEALVLKLEAANAVKFRRGRVTEARLGLIDEAFGSQPFRSRDLVDLLGISKEAAYSWTNTMADLGIMRRGYARGVFVLPQATKRPTP